MGLPGTFYSGVELRALLDSIYLETSKNYDNIKNEVKKLQNIIETKKWELFGNDNQGVAVNFLLLDVSKYEDSSYTPRSHKELRPQLISMIELLSQTINEDEDHLKKDHYTGIIYFKYVPGHDALLKQKGIKIGQLDEDSGFTRLGVDIISVSHIICLEDFISIYQATYN